MKIQKAAMKTDDFRVWCTGCSIRIAPHEEQIAIDGQTYHPRCYSKHFGATTAKDAPKRKASRMKYE
jgi:hypothetical protein